MFGPKLGSRCTTCIPVGSGSVVQIHLNRANESCGVMLCKALFYVVLRHKKLDKTG